MEFDEQHYKKSVLISSTGNADTKRPKPMPLEEAATEAESLCLVRYYGVAANTAIDLM